MEILQGCQEDVVARNAIMSNMTDRSKQTGVDKREGLRGKATPLLMLFLVIAITVGLFFYRDRVADLGNYGYLGTFLISVTCSATIILPMPGMLLIFALGAVLNPVFVGLVAAAGGAIGEITGFMLGHSGRRLVPSNNIYIKAEKWIRKWGTMTIFIFALVPLLPIDIVGIVAGSLRFTLWKFFLACLFGKALLYIGMAFAGAWGLEAVLQYFR